MLAWKFLPNNRRLNYGDGRLCEVGKKLWVSGPLKMCYRGLHWSVEAEDAIKFAPGFLLARVRVLGEGCGRRDKGCSQGVEFLSITDLKGPIRELMRDYLLHVIDEMACVHRFKRVRCIRIVDAWFRGEWIADVGRLTDWARREFREPVWAIYNLLDVIHTTTEPAVVFNRLPHITREHDLPEFNWRERLCQMLPKD